jgi:hypothetical protein
MKNVLLPILVAAALAGCTSAAKKEVDQIDQVQKLKSDSLKKLHADSIAKVNEADKAKNIERRDALKKNFMFKEDEFKKVGWYIHKNQTTENSWSRKFLKAHISSTGYIYLEDQYYASDWIFHTSISVKIGDKIYESSTVETFDENNKTENSGGSVWENINYLGEQDKQIIVAIAGNTEKEIKVRFNGKQYTSDFVLSKKDKEAIKEGYELAELIQKVGN